MERVIWKYRLQLGRNLLEIPESYRLLTVQNQRDEMVLWAEVVAQGEKVQAIFDVYGTGQPFSVVNWRNYIGTVQIGSFVWHVYQIWIGPER